MLSIKESSNCVLTVYASQILSKTASNEVMETVDLDISSTCKDLGEVKKVFQLALLCTRKQPSDRPTMHEVSRVLAFLVHPTPFTNPQIPSSKQSAPTSYADEYANLKTPNALTCTASLSTSDNDLFAKFGEVISQNSL